MSKIWEWIKSLFAEKPIEEPERPNKSARGEKLLRYPEAIVGPTSMRTRGKYPKGYPEGAIVHFTSGHSRKGDSDALNTVQGGIADGYCYFVVSSEGRIYQSFPLDEWGYHAGVSNWPGLGASVSTRLVGIEVACAGKVSKLTDGKFRSWFGEIYEPGEVRHVPNKVGNVQKGDYHKYTEAQETALRHLLLWLKYNNPEVFNLDWVLGHDEVAPDRKNDPGGSLSVPMDMFRAELNDKFARGMKM